MIDDVREFIRRVMSPRLMPPWWYELSGEQRQGRDDGRYMDGTLGEELAPDCPSYRSSAREQYFFSATGSTMDGRFKGVGVEEKCRELSFGGLVDGVISRGLVWVLGDPQDIPIGSRASVGLYVVRGASKPLNRELVEAFMPVLAFVELANVHVLFVHGVSGDFWPKPEGSEPVPAWLSGAGSQASSAIPPASASGVEALRLLTGPAPLSRSLFGRLPVWTEVAPGQAYAEWGNHWQMLEVGLVLRAKGYSAVRVTFTGNYAIAPVGRGVEQRVQHELASRFGVLLDWRTPLG